MKNKMLKYCALAALCLLSAYAAFIIASPMVMQANAESAPEYLARENIVIKKDNGEELIFSTEMALTNAEQAQGLMHRTHMEENEGMLFLFGNVNRRAFWMKNTLIPLDIIFIREDGTIHHIHSKANPLDETRITALEPSKAILEINGGLADQMGIKIGDKIYHAAFKNMNLLAQ